MTAVLTLVLTLASSVGAAHAAPPPPEQVGIETDVPGFGLWGPVVIILLRAAAAILAVVPSSPVSLAAGASQGLAWGSIYVLIGAWLGTLTAFLIGRHLGRDYVVRRGWMAAVAKTKWGGWLLDGEASQTRLMAAVFYCRLIPGINLDALSYVAGVTPIAPWRFCVATLAGVLPYTVLLVAIGQQVVVLGAAPLLLFIALVLGLGAMPALWRLLRLGSSKPGGPKADVSLPTPPEPGGTSPGRRL